MSLTITAKPCDGWKWTFLKKRICVCVCATFVSAEKCRRGVRLLELEFRVVTSCLRWVLGTKLLSSGERQVLNHWAVSSASKIPLFLFYWFFFSYVCLYEHKHLHTHLTALRQGLSLHWSLLFHVLASHSLSPVLGLQIQVATPSSLHWCWGFELMPSDLRSRYS